MILLIFGQNLNIKNLDIKHLKRVSPRKKSRAAETPRKLLEIPVFLRKSQKVKYRFPSFLVRKCKINFVSSRRKPDLNSFSTSEIFEPEDGSGGTITCRPGDKV